MTDSLLEQAISNQALFSDMAPEYIRFLASCAKKEHVEMNQVLFRYGRPADKFYLICSGRISIEIPAIEGPSLELQNLGPDKILGWSWLIPPYRWSFQARAVEPTTFIEFDGKAILDRCEQDPRFGYAMLKRFSALMSERLAFAREKMMESWNPPGFA